MPRPAPRGPGLRRARGPQVHRTFTQALPGPPERGASAPRWLRLAAAGGVLGALGRPGHGRHIQVLEAVADRKITSNPCRERGVVKRPRAAARKVEPWTGEQVAAVRAALPAQWQVLADLGAGLGLRQGEMFGLAVGDVDWLRKVVHVRRQVRIVGARLVFAEPKGGKPLAAQDHGPATAQAGAR
jgi:integrase